MSGSATIGALKILLGLDTAQFTSGLTKAQAQLKKTGSDMERFGGKLASVGAGLSLGITAPVIAIGAASIQAAKESQQAFGQVEAALKSMGGVSGKTGEQLKTAAAGLQGLSTFDDDEILQKVTANLLTFGNVSGEAFDRAQLAAVNLSARLGQDLQSSAIQVGKALNDPIKGITALQRVGVSFTAQQKEQITAMTEAGDVAGAQAIILGELDKQFGGAAKAMRDATPGADTIDAWREFQETIGAVALKVLPPLTSAITAVLDGFNNLSPGMQNVVLGGIAVAAAIGPVVSVVGAVTVAVGAALPVLGGLATLLTATLIPAVIATAPIWIPIALGVAAVTAAVAAGYLAWKNFDKIAEICQRLYEGVKQWIGDKLGAIMDAVSKKAKAVGDAFFTLYDRVVGHSYVPDMVKGVGDCFAKLGDLMVKPAEAANDNVAESFKGAAEQVKSAAEMMDDAFNAVGSTLDDVFRSVKNKDWGGAFRGLSASVSNFKEAWNNGGTGGRIGAVAGVGVAVGNAIGGTAGSTISGAASGAMTGFQMGGPVGAAAGAVIGGIMGFLSGKKAKKAQKAAEAKAAADAAAAAAAAEAARLQQIANDKRQLEIALMEASGDAIGARNARLQDELAAADDSLDPLIQKLFDLQVAGEKAAKALDVANERRSLEIQYMEATGNVAGALAAQRADELNALDESNRGLQSAIFAAEDYATSLEALSDAAIAARDAQVNGLQDQANGLRDVIGRFRQFSDSLRDFRASLDQEGAGPSYASVSASFRTTAASARLGDAGALGSLQGVSEQFLAVSKRSAKTAFDYARDLAVVKSAVTAAEETAGRTADVAQAQLEGIETQIESLNALDLSVKGVQGSVEGLGISILAQIKDADTRIQASLEMAKAAQASNLTLGAQFEALRAENAAALLAVAQNTGATARTLDRWDGDGQPEVRDVA